MRPNLSSDRSPEHWASIVAKGVGLAAAGWLAGWIVYLIVICSMVFTPCGLGRPAIAVAAGAGFLVSGICFAAAGRLRAGLAVVSAGLAAAFVVSTSDSTRLVLLAVDLAAFVTVAVALGGWLPRVPSSREHEVV